MTMPDVFLPAEAILLRDADAPDWKRAPIEPVRVEGTTVHYRVRVGRDVRWQPVFEPRQVEATPEAIRRYQLMVAAGQDGSEAILMRQVRVAGERGLS